MPQALKCDRAAYLRSSVIRLGKEIWERRDGQAATLCVMRLMGTSVMSGFAQT